MRYGTSFWFTFFLAGLGLAPTLARGWGGEGHETVAVLAATRLNAPARAAVVALLGSDDLAAVATWADEVRAAGRHRGALAKDPEAQRFCATFPKNPSWHFVDLPLGTKTYADDGPFSSPDDVVHAINDCVAVLEGRSTKFPPVQALKLLVHFVGDIHQPLHVSSGYFDLTNPEQPRLVVDAKAAAGKAEDRGGNLLYFTKSQEFHALWDGDLVKKTTKIKEPALLAARLKSEVRSFEWQTPGDYHQWAEQWATDSVHVAAALYRGLTFHRATMAGGKLTRIEIQLAPNYEKENAHRVLEQLAKAGFHLGELLNRIKWKLPADAPAAKIARQ